MTKKRFGTHAQRTDERISPDDLYNLVEGEFGIEGAKFAVHVAEIDDFDEFAHMMEKLGMPRCEDGGGTVSSEGKLYYPYPAIANAILCMRYPFLYISYSWDYDDEDSEHFRHTWFNDIPYGWAARFGFEICEDIRDILETADNGSGYPLEVYRLEQIKEKYGTLRWYDGGIWNEDGETYEVISSLNSLYEELSAATCIECGNIDDTWMTTGGWITPQCYHCMKSNRSWDAVNAFAEQHGFEKKWVPFELSEKISRFLTLETCVREEVDLKDIVYKSYSSEGEKEYSPYNRVHDRYPDLQIFRLAEDYKKYAKSEPVPDIEEIEEMIQEENAKK